MTSRQIVILIFFLGLWEAGSLGAALPEKADAVVLISANAEWAPVRQYLSKENAGPTPFGECLSTKVKMEDREISLVYVHGGWGKISAAASAQYAIDRWKPSLLINLGTCGGFEGAASAGDLLLAGKTVVYDIVEMMGDADEAISDYSTTLDLSWLTKPYPRGAVETILLSADRDIQPADIQRLRKKYGAVAADWESGAIAFTARRNQVPCLILRAVSDIVGARGGEAYGGSGVFEKRAQKIMARLMDALPDWLRAAKKVFPGANAARIPS